MMLLTFTVITPLIFILSVVYINVTLFEMTCNFKGIRYMEMCEELFDKDVYNQSLATVGSVYSDDIYMNIMIEI